MIDVTEWLKHLEIRSTKNKYSKIASVNIFKKNKNFIEQYWTCQKSKWSANLWRKPSLCLEIFSIRFMRNV